MANTREQVLQLVEPIVTDAGLDLLDVAIARAGKHTKVRIVVAQKGGVDIETCQAVGRTISRDLDQADPIKGGYTLEVTSPGIDWPLQTRKDFERVEGRLVHIEILDDDQPLLLGTVNAVTDDTVTIEDHDGVAHIVAFDTIKNAVQEVTL